MLTVFVLHLLGFFFFFFSLLFLTLFLKVSVNFVDFGTANTHGVTHGGPLKQGHG